MYPFGPLSYSGLPNAISGVSDCTQYFSLLW